MPELCSSNLISDDEEFDHISADGSDTKDDNGDTAADDTVVELASGNTVQDEPVKEEYVEEEEKMGPSQPAGHKEWDGH